MTTKQKQWQLYLLGYLDSLTDIDGVWGPKSAAATMAFQEDFFPDAIAWDGIFGPNTEAKSIEIIDAIQDVVTAYADVALVNDGLAGQKTMEAVEAYQTAHGLNATGIVDDATYAHIQANSGPLPDAVVGAENATAKDSPAVPEESQTFGDWRDEIKFFDVPKEFGCKCGGRYCNGYPAQMQEQVVRICDEARRHFGRPGHIVSGLRCQEWNRIQGGVANSQHMYGKAVDLRIDGVTADQLLAFIQTQPHRYAYKINGTNVHVDIPKGKR